jgi:ABC-type phosphate transport system substrate-binding protein
MIDIKKPVVLGVVASLALGIFAAVPAAHADPVSGSYVAVGSDTLDASMNGLTNGTKATGSSVRILAGGASVGSFDAFGSANVQTKPGGPYYTRPSGSGAGVNALIASVQGVTYGSPAVNIAGQVDIARSSSGPGTNASATGKLIYVPYARDAVAYAYYGSSTDLGALTTAQLKDLYTNGPTTIGTTLVTPLIPQASSGTRKFFLSAIGVSTDATCTMSTCATSTLPENDASVLTPGTIIPFSAANWVAQANLVAQNTIPASGNVVLGAPNGVAAFTGTAPALVPSATFYNAAPYGRDTYLVVEYARIDNTSAKYDATLAGLVDSTVATSLTNFGTAPSQPGAVKKKYGFLAPSTTTPQRAYPNI